MATGKIVQIIGSVIDVQFPREGIPRVYEALKLEDQDIALEVQQQLGDGVVRTIAMGASEGLGFLLVDGQQTFKPAQILAAIALFAVLGKLTDVALGAAMRPLLAWQDTVEARR